MSLQTRVEGGRTLVLDPVRRKWVALTPEEGVRQALLSELQDLGYPIGLLAVERAVTYAGKTWRADIVAYSRDQRPVLLAECKAPGVAIDQTTFDQLARYNAVLEAETLVVDNGTVRYCCVLEGGEAGGSSGAWRFVDAIPPFAG